MFFGFFIAISIHIFTCLWMFIANFSKERSWLTLKQEQIIDQGEKIEGNVQAYFLSLYFVTQTFTTVGYGDVNPSNTLERCFVVVLMLAGVFAFSFASGSLASIMQNYDSQQAVINERLMLLDNMSGKFEFSTQLYEDLRDALSYDHQKNNEDLDLLLQNLPHKLRIQVIMAVYKDLDTAFPIFLQLSEETKGSLLQWISVKLE